MNWLSRLAGRFPRLVIARRNVSRAKVRSILAAAAILIGVVAIGTIGAGGAAFKQSQLDSIQSQGATNVFLSPGPDKEQQYFDREDLVSIEEVVGPAGIVATKEQSMEYVERAGRREQVSVTYLDDPRVQYDIGAGEFPANWRQRAVVSAAFATEHGVQPGDRVKLVQSSGEGANATETERAYRVVAVLEPTQSFGVSEVFLPIEEAQNRQYSQVRITTTSVERAERVATALRERFNDREDRLLVFELTSLVRLFQTIVNGINLFLVGLGGISLLVAGVSIANTMLMAVIKRREEIGVLRSVGYTKGDIVRILLAEAALLGAIGAGGGFVIALAATMVANAVFLGDPLAFSRTAMLYLLGAVAFGVGTSLLAGAYPAWRAASERPVDALRS
ncbi:ABC transporter permease [Salinigranum halophilum]|uniref:ABC transporter permease n=1 Tax=Salinigranum halophilum TaxID=2565931 RepID=UPI00115F0A11|nr:ABC transporter permease [Salinigranum halophilum]